MPNIKYLVVNKKNLIQFIVCHRVSKLFYKGPGSKIFGLVKHTVSISITWLNTGHESSRTVCKQMNVSVFE